MELDEFHVRHLAAGAPGQGDAVAGGDVRVAGVKVHFAGPAGGQHHHFGAEGGYPVASRVQYVRSQHPVVGKP